MIRRCLALLAAIVLFMYAERAGAEPPSPEAAGVEPGAKAGKAGDDDEDETDEEEAKEKKGSYRVHPSGRRYRVRFDPASRVTLSGGLAVMHDGEGSAAAAFEAGLSFSYRKVYRFGGGADRITWQIDHQLTSGVVRPFLRHAGGVPSMDASLYRATLLRHSESPSIVLPLSPPVTIGFPFDVGLDAELGRVTVPVMPVSPSGVSAGDAAGAAPPAGVAGQPWLHLGVARVSFTLDPWRSGQVGRSLALGVGVRYDVDVYPAPSLQTPVFVHRIAPLTSGSARLRYQTDDGLWMLDAYGEAAPHWTSENRWDLSASVSARVDRTLLAINDQPIGAYAEAGYRYLPEGAGAPALHDVRGTLGIAASLSLK